MTLPRIWNPAGQAAFVVAYVALGWLGVWTGQASGSLAAGWPALGFGLGSLVLAGISLWPGIVVGSAFVALTTGSPLLSALTGAAAQAAALVLGARLVDRLAAGPAAFDRPRTIVRFTTIAAGVCAPVIATAGALTGLADSAAWLTMAASWVDWWTATLAGLLLVAPVTVLWGVHLEGWAGRTLRIRMPAGRWSPWVSALLLVTPVALLWFLVSRPSARRRRAEEWLAMASVLLAAGLMAFAGLDATGQRQYPFEWVCVPVLLWAAFRLGRRGTATAMVVLAGAAVWGTVAGDGSFARVVGAGVGLTLVQVYAGLLAVTGLVLASVVAERRDANAELEVLATTDPVTGLANHRRLLDGLRDEIARAHRSGQAFVVTFFDVNDLDAIEAAHGHLAGSRVLGRVAEATREAARAGALTARYGRDAFAIVLPEATEADGDATLSAIGARLAAGAEPPTVSITGGVAVFPRDGESPTMLLRAADRLLAATRARRSEVPAPASPVADALSFDPARHVLSSE